MVLDSADFANGLASPIPFNYSMVFLSPPDEGELLQNREWLELVLTHELFHVVHLDMARGPMQGLRRVFGRLPFLFPNALQPGWIIEGLAVHAESQPERGYGRLGNSYFEGMMRAEATRGFRSLAEVNAAGRGFPLNRDYLYGAYFFAFLQDRYGREALGTFIENYSDNVIPFRVHSNPLVATGKNMDALWNEYHAWLTARFAYAPSNVQQGEVLVRDWLVTNPTLTAGGTRWYIQGSGYTQPKVMRQERGGKPKALRPVEQDARLAASPEGRIVLAQPEICRNYNYYYDLYLLKNGERLTECGRYRYAAPLDDGRIAAVRMDGGIAEVVIVGAEMLYRAAQDESVTGIAARGSSVVITTLREERWSVIEVTGARPEILVSDAAIKHSPRMGERDEVFFVADYGKVFNVWSLRRGGALSRWTEAAHGVREISAPHGGEILLTTIEPDGDALRVYRLPDKPIEILAVGPAQPVQPKPATSIETPDRPYSPWSSLLPRSWLPQIEIAEGAVALGVFTFGQDALGKHQYIFAPLYEFTQQELLGSMTYMYDFRHELLVDRVMTVRETVDNEVRSYTIEEGLHWISTWRHLALNRRFYWGLGGALERERLHQVDGPTSPELDERVLGLVAGVDTRRTHWLSEGPSEGMQLRLFAENSYGDYSGQMYRADLRIHLPVGRTVLALRWNEAWADPTAEPFQLGGSDTDPPSVLPLFNQRDFPLRGYSSGEPSLTGHRARLGSVEWRVPLRDVDRHGMVPPVGLNRIAVNLFFDVGDAWLRGADADYHRGYGVELMTEARLGYFLPLGMRLGFARGADEGGRSTAYLRVGRSF